MDIGESLEKYITRYEEVRRAHKEYNVDLLDFDCIWAILCCLPQDWSLTIISLQPDQIQWTLDNILARLRKEELRKTKLSRESALMTGRMKRRDNTTWKRNPSLRKNQPL